MTGQDPAERYMIDSVETPPGGCIGLTPCPGSVRFPSARESWQRDLGADFDVIAEWGASAVVSLVQAAELKSPALDDWGPTPGVAPWSGTTCRSATPRPRTASSRRAGWKPAPGFALCCTRAATYWSTAWAGSGAAA